MDKIEFEYKMTEKDYRFIYYEMKTKWFIDKLPFYILLCFIFFLYVLLNPTLFSIGFLVLMILLITLFFVVTYFVVRKKVNSFDIYQYQITDDGIRVMTSDKSIYYPFNNLKKIIEYKSYYYCLFLKDQFLIIPIKYLPIDDFIPLVKEKSPKLILDLNRK